MSYILDALKKSERERQRSRGPDLQSIHTPAPSRSGGLHWALILTVVMTAAVVAAAVAVWLLWMERAEPEAMATPASTPVQEAAEQAVAAEKQAEPEAPIAESPVAESPAQPAEPPSPPRLQELWELPDPVRESVPALTFSFHVYSEDPSRRTIIINNRRMREGERVSDAWRLEEITREGVILASDQHRVQIPVVEQW